MNFIVTSSEESANKLIAAGYQLIQKHGKTWQFLNDASKADFAKDLEKTTLTNCISC